MEWEAVIGLEVHAQLRTKSKLFCGCSTDFGVPPNSQVCPICLGHPGVLPVPNRRAVELAVRMGLACGAAIHPVSLFARKNYFYPDLPKNYQISQFDRPLCEGGSITIRCSDEPRRIRITRIHLEEDAGKSKHPEKSGSPWSLVDLNRCGVPLIEIVSEPDLRTPAEAHAYFVTLRRLLVWLDVCDGNMEQGSLRCDANISLRPAGSERYGTRTELKNLNSFRFVEKALTYEIDRQREILEGGGQIEQETRSYDPEAARTRVLRGKEEAHDYRYFPEPDLPPVVLTDRWIEDARSAMPELPEARRDRFIRELSVAETDAELLTTNRELADYFETVVAAGVGPRLAGNWVLHELQGRLNERGLDVARTPVTADGLAGLLDAVTRGVLSGRQAKEVFDEAFQTGRDPQALIRERGMEQVSEPDALALWVREVIEGNPGQVASYLSGKESLLNFFTGQVMRISGGKANPGLVAEILKRELPLRRRE